ncbi:glycoside hydrolase family 15 protein [Nocardioides sp.]|jgi:GH15 family glucan-1,4-alpha-glucosidase|uniref:glycoside hydrolase family 15 protein n=1 Tax=Nocardioides sp. TaxID=35761 RepID=UPI002C458E6A|nr:glycoside hydrolase family 15 protein [Nocardioides sp.]HVX54078.1 glycoside hydrolase family 15 protein [Nocardioides sp.]
MALPIKEYALIGDRRTAALVGSNGSVDWLCLPGFDSPASFAALLGTEENGFWRLAPTGSYQVRRRYIGASSALETTFTTAEGEITLTDVMPAGDGRADLVRILRGVRGRVQVAHAWVVRCDYGRILPWVRREEVAGERVITAVAGPDMLVLRGPRLPEASDHRHSDVFEVAEGDELVFATSWLPSYRPLGDLGALGAGVEETIAADEEWAQRCAADVPHRDIVVRSLQTLRLMTDAETGGIVAAPTTSLPEDFGGERNWDYRYCWLRDAALTISSLIRAGYAEEATLWREWLLRTVAGDPQDLQVLYGIDGRRRLGEYTLDDLPGYANSRPVRIGNAAVEQLQNDLLGEVLDALYLDRALGAEPDPNAWSLQRALVTELGKHWRDPDNGLWEIRGQARHFTHSRLMAWVAFDRVIRGVEEQGLDGPVEEWRTIREEIREAILKDGYDETRNTFVQHDATTEVDAALLMIPMMGFLPGDDPRVLGTIKAVEEDLMRDGLVLRYRTQSGVDGLTGDEHPFLACSFWLVAAYASAGRWDDANALFDRLVGLTNDVGLLSEEYDPVQDRMVGNFPQAFSHLALIHAAFALAGAAPSGAAPVKG